MKLQDKIKTEFDKYGIIRESIEYWYRGYSGYERKNRLINPYAKYTVIHPTGSIDRPDYTIIPNGIAFDHNRHETQNT